MAQLGAKLWKKYGALQYTEAIGDDLAPKGTVTRFPKLAKTKSGETVVFSFIVYKSRKHRDSVNKKVMSDPVMNDPKMKNMVMPFDPKRMAYGGFKALVEW